MGTDISLFPLFNVLTKKVYSKVSLFCAVQYYIELAHQHLFQVKIIDTFSGKSGPCKEGFIFFIKQKNVKIKKCFKNFFKNS